MQALLEVRNLKMYYQLEDCLVRAVDDVSFDLDRGETLGMVGESGCGKSSLGYTILRVLPRNALIVGGSVFYDGIDLLKLDEKAMRRIRGAEISMVFQSAMNALNPVLKVKDEPLESVMTHERISHRKATRRVVGLFEEMGIRKSRMNSYPHELSGGMKQRVVIALSLICNPKILIADEPTTALDVLVQEQILQIINSLQKRMEIAMLLISHDISVVTETCEKVAVMYAGKIVEIGKVVDIFKNPSHPYTVALMQSFPSIHGEIRKLSSIPGKPPNLAGVLPVCRFSPRCWLKERCRIEKCEMFQVEEDHYTSCPLALDCDLGNLYGEILERQV